MKDFSLLSKTILITGASSGIGKACAQACSEAGAQVLLVARNKEKLNEAYNHLKGKGHQIYSIDLTDFEAVNSFIKELQGNKIRIDGIVHAAGLSLTHPFKYMNIKKLDALFQINVYAAYELSRLVIKSVSNKGLSIVFIASVMGTVGEKAKSAYSMTKGALLSGSRSLALEMAPQQMRVNCISPGVIETPMTQNATYKQSEAAYNEIIKKHPLGKLGEPEDVANACVFLLSNASKWVTGIDLKIDGGYSAQ